MTETNFHTRLRRERKRLKIKQGDLAKIGGVSRVTQIHYEKGQSSPGDSYWYAVAKAGIDVQYVLTGIYSLNTKEIHAQEINENSIKEAPADYSADDPETTRLKLLGMMEVMLNNLEQQAEELETRRRYLKKSIDLLKQI